MEEDKKIVVLQDTTNWFKSLSLSKSELPKKKKLLPKPKARPKMIFPNSLKVR